MKQEVFMILDDKFAGDLWSISQDRHVWICDSPTNTPMIEQVWAKSAGFSSSSGVSSFKLFSDKVCVCYDFLYTVNEHHDGLSGPNPWQTIRVIGVELKDFSLAEAKECLSTEVTINDYGDYFEICRVG